ncbi:MAG: DUF2157 domain-containing protein [Actinomycetes bacterium]
MNDKLADAPPALPELLDRWVSRGLISRDQADRIRDEERVSMDGHVPVVTVAEPAPAAATSMVVEALGYLGGVLVVIAAGLLTARYWDGMPLALRLSLISVTAAVLLIAGAAVPERLGSVGVRLRAVLWLLSAVACATFLALLGGDGFDWRGEDVALLAGAGTSVYAGLLWWWNHNPAQELALFVALSVTAAAACSQLGDSGLPGLGVWGVGVTWLALTWGGLLSPRRTSYVLGSVGALFGAEITMEAGWGLGFALVTVAALVALAVLFRDLLLLAVGAIGALQVIPQAVSEWFPGALAAPLALLAVGVLLIAAAVRTARRREARPHGTPERDYTRGPAKTALAVAGCVVVGVTGGVLAVGLL